MGEAIFEFAADQNNPCLSCGICCTHFRVSFYWGEADDAPGGWVPVELTEPLNPWRRCMKGTNGSTRRCAALAGTVGKQVSCTIYAQRPSPCREFPVYLANGIPNPKCQELRARAGLPPLPAQVLGANDEGSKPTWPPSAA
jgi:Fe-S-cluster containining protein